MNPSELAGRDVVRSFDLASGDIGAVPPSAALRVAAIDIGTNSVLLLIAERRGDTIIPLVEAATITRLGQGVDKTRTLAPEAVERTLACLQTYATEIQKHAPCKIAVVGTSAMRDATGGMDFRERARAILSVVPAVVSGDEEAELTFVGSLSGLETKGKILVFDVGGGSTEIILGTREGGPEAKVSLDIGSVRLTERHVRTDPPTEAELLRVREDVRRALATASFLGSAHLGGPPVENGGDGSTVFGVHFVGVAGTLTTLAAFIKNVVPYDGGKVHGATLRTDEIANAAAYLASIPQSERKSLPAMEPKRADVIVSGAILVEELLRFCGATFVTVSDRGVRWGLAVRALSQQ